MSEAERGKKRKRSINAAANQVPGKAAQTEGAVQLTSPFEEVELKVCVSLLPSDMGRIYEGIRTNIYKFLMKYNRVVGGVVMAVSDIKFAPGREDGLIMDEMPHIHFDIMAKAQVFRPQPGNVLVGRVNKVTSTHVGMLVCGIFNASVAAEELPSGYEYDLMKEKWHGEGEDIVVGVELRFAVIRLHQAGGLISMEGSISNLPTICAASAEIGMKSVFKEEKNTTKGERKMLKAKKPKKEKRRRKTIG